MAVGVGHDIGVEPAGREPDLAADADCEGELASVAVEPVLAQPQPSRRLGDRQQGVAIVLTTTDQGPGEQGACSITSCTSRARAASGVSSSTRSGWAARSARVGIPRTVRCLPFCRRATGERPASSRRRWAGHRTVDQQPSGHRPGPSQSGGRRMPSCRRRAGRVLGRCFGAQHPPRRERDRGHHAAEHRDRVVNRQFVQVGAELLTSPLRVIGVYAHQSPSPRRPFLGAPSNPWGFGQMDR
jgi:hypothetical protein